MSGSQSWRQLVEMWANDRRAGATEIAQGCAGALTAYADQAKPGTPQEVEKIVLESAKRLLASHAAMAPVVRLLNDVLIALQSIDTVRLALDTIRRVSSEYNALVEQANALVVESALTAFPRQGTVVTVSYSSAVAKSLVLASKEGYVLKVICLESRPGLEGQDLAAFLSRVGLDVSLVVDASALVQVQRADLVLSGVDSMGLEGVVNKVGTGILALAARTYQVPALPVGDTSKIWPHGLGMPVLPQADPREVWDGAPAGVSVQNAYYELTPWDFFSGAITERGVTTQAEVANLAQSIPVDARLKAILRRS